VAGNWRSRRADTLERRGGTGAMLVRCIEGGNLSCSNEAVWSQSGKKDRDFKEKRLESFVQKAKKGKTRERMLI